MANALLVVHVLAAVAIVVLVLMQQGRGADMGAAFGGGSQTLFGARGSANFLTRITALLATIFFVTSMTLAYLYGKTTQPQSVTEQVIEQPQRPQGEIPQAPEAEGAESPSTGADTEVPTVPQPTEN